MDILNALEDLREDEFQTFKWYLQQPDILGGYQAIKVSKLEEAKRWDTVNVMVNTYKPDGALKVTKKVLEKINRNDLVQRLSDTSSGPRAQLESPAPWQPSASPAKAARQHDASDVSDDLRS
ncbi:hypothetical protein ABVT39_026953 [Epinephelus coioides]